MNTLLVDRPDLKPAGSTRPPNRRRRWFSFLAALVVISLAMLASACGAPAGSSPTTGAGAAMIVFLLVFALALALARLVLSLMQWLAEVLLPKLIRLAVLTGIAALAALVFMVASAVGTT
jgi:hypothetical protein